MWVSITTRKLQARDDDHCGEESPESSSTPRPARMKHSQQQHRHGKQRAVLLLLAPVVLLVSVLTSTTVSSVLNEGVELRSSFGLRATPEQEQQEAGDDSSSLRNLAMSASPPGRVYLATIIGAGVAGLSSAYQLRQEGIDNVIILEASERLGGRVGDDRTFLGPNGPPIEIGAAVVGEPWLVEEVMNKNGRSVEFQPVSENDTEVTFVNYTYFDWLANDVAPQEPGGIVFGCQVDRVNFMGNVVETSCGNRTFVSEYVVVTPSLQILRDGDIAFAPPLPPRLTKGHPGEMWHGIKAFVKFSKNFFRGPPFHLVNPDNGECYFWDYAAKSGSDHHVLTGYIMGEPFRPFEKMTEKQLLRAILRQMDMKFAGQATKYYSDHFFVNWTNSPFVRGTYSSQGLEGPFHVQQKVLIAGEAFPVKEKDHGWVHGAFKSGTAAAELILSFDKDKEMITNT